MTLDAVISELCERISAEQGAITLDWHDVQQWPDNALQTIINAGLIKPTVKAQSIICPGCEYACFSEVVFYGINQHKSAFIVCDEPEKQADMGRIRVDKQQLKQWQTSIRHFANAIARLLNFDPTQIKPTGAALKLGTLKGIHGRRWLTVINKPLSIELNNAQILVDELLFFNGDELAIDKTRINELLNAKTKTPTKAYQPSTTRREKRRSETAVMHQNWQDQYEYLKQRHPDKSKIWIAGKIAKMDVALGRSLGTIYRVIGG